MNQTDGGRDRRLAWAIFALLSVTYAYFYQGGGWNENSHLDLTRALVDQHTLTIDAYHSNTGDKAKVFGHYYSDKAPGLSVAAIPAYVSVKLLRSHVSDHDFVVLASYLTTVFTVGLGTAFLGLLLYRASRRLGASPRGSTLAAVSFGVGTTAFPFATQFFSHQLASLLLFSSFWLLWSCRERHSDLASFGAGVSCAAAITTELPTAAVALILLVYHAVPERRWRRIGTFGAGVASILAPLGIYFMSAFGSPFRTGYSTLASSGPREEMLGQGLFGLTYPHLDVLVQLLISRYRGLLPYSPVLLLAGAGFLLGFGWLGNQETRPHGLVEPPRRELYTALAVVIYYLMFVSSYAWWHGGSSFGSRHLLPMLPFLVLPLAWAADARPKLTLTLFVLSFAFMLIVTSVQPKPSERLHDPFFSNILPAFLKGEVAWGNVCPLLGNSGGPAHRPLLRHAFHDSFNLGMVVAGRRLLSLLPLLALWLSSGYFLWRASATVIGKSNEESAQQQDEASG
jgi:hypothetical protein